MLERLRHRVDEAGWNARFVGAHGAGALGSAVLDATPEAAFERERPIEALSLQTSDGEMLWLAGDIRLDGRSSLLSRLGLDAMKARDWSDGRLVLEAYVLWREESPIHLQGDFAFAVWNEMRRSLFCARDRFGVRPFYFAFVPGVVFACANEIKALWPALPFAPRPDQAHIGDYLSGEFTSFTRTFYEGVERLPPAHTLLLNVESPDPPRQNRYFVLDVTRELELPHDADYAQTVKVAFQRSVADRSRGAGGLSAFLSGGLDSSSVAAVAAPPSFARCGADSRAFDGF